ETFHRISSDPSVMGDKPTIRGMRVTVGMVAGIVKSVSTAGEILALYPYLEPEDIQAALDYRENHSDPDGCGT
ncbi:MAG: DUF433 domain-containing protein, partial [Desulfococcaceae bacterium]